MALYKRHMDINEMARQPWSWHRTDIWRCKGIRSFILTGKVSWSVRLTTQRSLADLRGERDVHPFGVQILSISCSFRENLAKSYVGAPDGGLAPPPRGNPGSATGGCFGSNPTGGNFFVSGIFLLWPWRAFVNLANLVNYCIDFVWWLWTFL